MASIARFIRSLFAWKRVNIGGSGIWSYWENTVTGNRKAIREYAPVISPVNWPWLMDAPSWKVIDVDRVTSGRRGEVLS